MRYRLKSFSLIRTRGDQRLPKNNCLSRLFYQKFSDKLIACNSIIAKYFTQELKVDPEKVHLILGGVDEKAFYADPEARKSIRKQLGYTDKNFVIGVLGRLDPVKGHQNLIKAVALFKKKYPQDFKLKLLFIGKAANLKEQDLQELAQSLGLSEHLQITGSVDNVNAYLNALNLGVISSIASEAIARAALEIMAAQIPLLSSDVGIMPDLLPQNLLYPKDDFEALSKALEQYLLYPDKLEELKNSATKGVKNLYSQSFLKEALAVYQKALMKN